MAIFEHGQVSDRMRRSPFYYERWHRCMQPSCRTTVVMRDQDRHWNVSGEDRANLESWLTKHAAAKRKAG
jgi:hypothetical protein